MSAGESSQLARFLDAYDDGYFHLYVMRFVFGASFEALNHHYQRQHTAPLIESFRERCRQVLDRKQQISDLGMRRAFQACGDRYELILAHRERGFCLLRGTYLEASVLLEDALRIAEQRYIKQLDARKAIKSGVDMGFDQNRFAESILALPEQLGRALLLRYGKRCSFQEMRDRYGIEHPRGLVEYARERLSYDLNSKMLLSHRALAWGVRKVRYPRILPLD